MKIAWILFLLAFVIGNSGALRCHKCIRFNCAYDNQTVCDALERTALKIASQKYFDNVPTSMLPRCPPLDEANSWTVLENWRESECKARESHCLLTGFEIRTRGPTNRKTQVSVGTITGCSSTLKRRDALRRFGANEFCMIDDRTVSLTIPLTTRRKRNSAPANSLWNNTVAFETCHLDSGDRCSSCRVCYKDFCINKTDVIPKRVVMVATEESVIVARYILGLVVISIVALVAADKDFPWVL